MNILNTFDTLNQFFAGFLHLLISSNMSKSDSIFLSFDYLHYFFNVVKLSSNSTIENMSFSTFCFTTGFLLFPVYNKKLNLAFMNGSEIYSKLVFVSC